MNKLAKKIILMLSLVLTLTLVSCSPRFQTSFSEGEYLATTNERYSRLVSEELYGDLEIEKVKITLEEIPEEEYLSRRYVNPEYEGLKIEDITDKYPEYKIFYKNAIRNLYDNNCYELSMYIKLEGEEDFIKYDVSSVELMPISGAGPVDCYQFYLYFNYDNIDLIINVDFDINTTSYGDCEYRLTFLDYDLEDYLSIDQSLYFYYQEGEKNEDID